jgi:hypothetical protein
MNSNRFSYCLAAVIALGACNLYDATEARARIAGVYIGIGYTGFVSDVFLTLGDRDSIQAQAFSGDWPNNQTIYDSSIEPRRFQYRSSNPAVATVDSLGRITTLSVGETALTASVANVISPTIRLMVSPRAAGLLAQPDSVLAHVGETFSVSVEAVDSAGLPVPDIIFNVGLDTTWWAVTSQPAEGDWKIHTPRTLNLQAKMPGRVKLILTVQNERPDRRFQATVPVLVLPQ